MTITTAQIRGARGILNWSQSDLAERTGISATSIGSIENGQSTPRENTLKAIRQAFEYAGIEFLGKEGVRLRRNDIHVYEGKNNFWGFYEDVYQTIKDHPGTIMVSNANEREFKNWLTSEQIEIHTKRMTALDNVHYKIMIQEGDTYFLASSDYAEYKWMPKDQFASVPFYVYGDKLAILLFKDEPTVIVINYPSVAEAYRVQFMAMWAAGSTPANKAARQK